MTMTNIILLIIIGVLLLLLYISFKAGVHTLVKYRISQDVTIKILNTIKQFIDNFNTNHKDIRLNLKFIGKPDKIIELSAHPVTITDFNTVDTEISSVKVKLNKEDKSMPMYMIENKYGVLLVTPDLYSMSFKSIDRAIKDLAELTKIKTLIKIKQNG